MTIGLSIKRAAIRALPRVQIYKRAKYCYVQAHGRPPNLFFPKTFSEKVQHRKLFDRDARLPDRADKLLVKDFVRGKIGAEWVIETIWSGSSLPPECERNWPLPFVLKATHGSGWNVFVRSESDRNWPEIDRKVADWMKEPYGVWGGEWLYRVIQPGLIVEPFIATGHELPTDYKFWVFAGRCRYVQVDTDRETGHKRTLFDLDWNRMPFAIGFPVDQRPISKPANLHSMIKSAELLAEDIPFVRIDFYEVDGTPKFGEMTFYPGSGMERFDPLEFDLRLGQMWPSSRSF